MSFEITDQDAPFARMEKPGFKNEVRTNFADWLEERATDPLRTGPASARLADLAERVRRGEKLQRVPIAIEIFRGVFMVDGPMSGRLTQFEIDALEKDFFE